MVEIERLDQTNWSTLRDLRMAALIDAPDAFWATWRDESQYGPEEWVGFIRNVDWLTAVRNTKPVGLVGCLKRAECPDQIEVVGMWVQPGERGSGTADALLRAACDSATAQGINSMSLWVTSGNDRARRFYERHDFRATGERTPLPVGRQVEEERMRRELGRS